MPALDHLYSSRSHTVPLLYKLTSGARSHRQAQREDHKSGELASEVRWKLLAFTIALVPHQSSRNSAGKDSSLGAGYLLSSLKGPPLENETLGQPLFIHFSVSSCRKLHSLTYNSRPSEQSGLISLFQPCAPTCSAHIFSPDSGADSLFPELPFHHPSFSSHRESIICSSQINLPLH